MTRLSQKELLDEGIGSMLKKFAQVGLKGAVAGAKELGKAIAPETAKALSKIGTAASGAFVEIMGANAKVAIKSWLAKPEGKRLFKNVQLNKEKRLHNRDVEVDFIGQYMDPSAPNVPQDKEGKFIVRPIDEGRWRIIRAVDLDGEDIWSGEYKKGDDKDDKKDKPDKPDKPEVPLGPDPGRPEVPEVPVEPEEPEPEGVSTANFKEKLKEFVLNNKSKWDPSNQHPNSKLAIREFVRNLAKEAGNSNWYKNIPGKLKQIKKDERDWSNKEMMTLANQLKFDGIIKESQKNVLRQLQLLSR